ncbi:alpha/beta hydrolase [Brevundimonas sp.]|uniref:alpha/beta hydrolase n=1 Tax=Brevundimonas sp. TaxID=1871086 RepID=UPI003F6F7768
MARTRFILVAVLAVTAAFGAPACGDPPEAKSASAAAPTTASEEQPGTRIGVWRQPAGLVQSPIWPGVAPDMDGVTWAPESVLTRYTPEAVGGTISQAVLDVSVPTMTVFPPKGHNTGAAVIVFPGGGFRALALTIEGTEICAWITAKGMTCILSKYRVPGTNHYWNPDCRCSITPDVPRALQDAQRTIRLVRAHAVELGVQPDKIGVMGFSAGGYLVAQTSNIFEPTYTTIDAIDRVSSRPDFAIAFFPGHICRRGRVYEPGFEVSRRAPPTFLLQAWDDDVDDICNSTHYARALDDAGVPAEVHLFASGGHAFGLRRNHSPDTVWPGLLENWLKGIGVL